MRKPREQTVLNNQKSKILNILSFLGEIIMFEGNIVVYKNSVDVFIYLIGGPEENELILSAILQTYYDALSILLK